MKFTFARDTMLKEISIAQEIIATKNALSILSNVFIQAKNNILTIRATDVKMNFEVKIPAEIVEEGEITVFCDKFIGILNSLPVGDAEFYQDGIKIIIQPLSKKVIFTLKSISGENFPDFPTNDSLIYIDFFMKNLKEMLMQTVFAVSDDETRHFMNGVFLEKDGENIVMVSTDGRRLAYSVKPFERSRNDFSPAIVPPKILSIILKCSTAEEMISFALTDKTIYFKFGNYQFSSVLIDGQFPNYRRVIPEHQEHFFEIKKSDLSEALKRVGILVEQKSRRVLFELKSGTLIISSEESDIGSVREEILCNYEDESAIIAMNYQYIDESVKAINTERIRFEFTETMKAVTVKPSLKNDYLHVIMPMQIE
jgi:DNA polymerase-3 subunit beta